MTDLRMIRVTPEVMDRWWTRDHDGNRLRVEWGEPDTAGFYEPAISADYTDNIHAADKATIATLRAALDGLVEAAGWHLDNANRPNEGHVRLRAALATAYAATCSAESDQQVSATKEAGG